MVGGNGNDTYVVDNLGDVVLESTGGGYDTVSSSVTFDLRLYDVTAVAVEQINLTGSGNVNAYGNSLDNKLIGNSGNNEFEGGGGNDTIDGGAGFDVLKVDGVISDFVITKLSASVFRIQDMRAGSPLGTDIISNIERIDFVGTSYLPASVTEKATVGAILLGTDSADNENVYVGFDNDHFRSMNNDATRFPPRADSRTANLRLFGSAHPSGFNAVLCDGSVRVIRYQIDVTTYMRLGHITDGQQLGDF